MQHRAGASAVHLPVCATTLSAAWHAHLGQYSEFASNTRRFMQHYSWHVRCVGRLRWPASTITRTVAPKWRLLGPGEHLVSILPRLAPTVRPCTALKPSHSRTPMQPKCVPFGFAPCPPFARMRSCGAHRHAVRVLCAGMRCGASACVRRRVVSVAGISAGEGWDGQGSLYTCANAAEIDANFQIQLCAVRPTVWPR